MGDWCHAWRPIKQASDITPQVCSVCKTERIVRYGRRGAWYFEHRKPGAEWQRKAGECRDPRLKPAPRPRPEPEER